MFGKMHIFMYCHNYYFILLNSNQNFFFFNWKQNTLFSGVHIHLQKTVCSHFKDAYNLRGSLINHKPPVLASELICVTHHSRFLFLNLFTAVKYITAGVMRFSLMNLWWAVWAVLIKSCTLTAERWRVYALVCVEAQQVTVLHLKSTNGDRS